MVELYISVTLNTPTVTPEKNQPINYLLILQLAVFASMMFADRYIETLQETQKLELMELSNRYRYENLVEKQMDLQNVKKLQHDMKNHLLALRVMSKESEDVDSYIDSLLDSYKTHDSAFHSGNDLLDGLLAQKSLVCNEKNIDFEVDLNFLPSGFIEPVDVCAIFGNILDNAIEAACQAENGLIRLWGKPGAGNLIVTCSNTYVGQRKFINGELPSSKSNKTYHGIGLQNVKEKVSKYKGTITVDLSQEGVFTIRIFLPLPSERNL